MTKKYVISGYIEYSMVLKGKNGYIRCHFEKGAVSGLGYRAAAFTTDKEVVQETIENSDKFKNGIIKLAEVYGDPKPAGVEPSNAYPNAYPDVTNIQSARAVLGAMGVPIEQMQTKAEVLKMAKEKNITFPNWR